MTGTGKLMKSLSFIFLLILISATACRPDAPAVTENPSDNIAITGEGAAIKGKGYAVTNVTIIDVEKGIAVPGQTIVINGDRIDQIGLQGEVTIPNGTKATIDGQGLYVIPGLVDAHVHYYEAPTFGRLLLANGVLLVRDMGMPNEYILKLRDELNRGETLGPEMIASGLILDGSPALIPSISLGITTPEEGRAAVRQQAEAGADFIKTYSRLDKDVFLAILDEARKYDLKVASHLPETIYIEDAAAAGLGSSEHFNGFEKVVAKYLGEPVRLTFNGQAFQAGTFQRLDEVNPEDLQAVYQRIRSSGLTICPTVVTFKILTQNQQILSGSFPNDEFISQSVIDLWKLNWSQQANLEDFIWRSWVQMVRDLNQAGVPLMVGTDLLLPGILPGYSVHEEMAIWQEAGIPPADVLRSATIVPAQFMGLGDRLGSVTEGKSASIVLLRANPLEDIRNAQLIEGLFLRGQYFNREALDQLLLEAKELAQQPSAP